MVGIQHLLCWGLGLIPGLGTKISHQGAAHQGQERERERERTKHEKTEEGRKENPENHLGPQYTKLQL